MSSSKFGHFKSFAKSIGYTICTVHFVTYYIVDLTSTKGPSMSPEISDKGTIVLFMLPPLLRLIRGQEIYRKNDIVISTSPLNPNKRICKRISGITGDIINNKRVPTGHLWLQGDNTNNSLDSRHYGAISSSLILGRVFMILSLDNGLKIL